MKSAQALLSSIGRDHGMLNNNKDGGNSSSAVAVMTAGRGRGKSAALGLALAAAVEAGLPNLYVTAPSPENLGTVMQFAVRGLASFGYEEHQDYTVTRSLDPEHNQAIVRIEVSRQSHRQSLVYMAPWELAGHLGMGEQQADLVCVDEAAAIPLALVRLIVRGPRLVFLSSTVNGYEGTGRSLSLKLIKQLRQECRMSETSVRVRHTLPQCVSRVLDNTANAGQSAELSKGLRSGE